MRVQNGAVDSPDRSTRANAAQNSVLESKSNGRSPADGSADHVSLSNATSLVSLANGMMPADKVAKFQAISAQFRSGEYEADAPGTSQAIVQGHVQS